MKKKILNILCVIFATLLCTQIIAEDKPNKSFLPALGCGYTDNTGLFKNNSVFELDWSDKDQVHRGATVTTDTTRITFTESELEDIFGLGFSVEAGLFGIGASTINKFYNETKNTYLSLSFLRSIKATVPVQVQNAYRHVLEDTRKMAEESPDQFRFLFGDKFVSMADMTATIILRIKFDFNNYTSKKNFESISSVKFSRIFEGSTELSKEIKEKNIQGRIEIDAIQIGGSFDYAKAMLAEVEDSQRSGSLEDIDKIVANTLIAFNNYLAKIEGQFSEEDPRTFNIESPSFSRYSDVGISLKEKPLDDTQKYYKQKILDTISKTQELIIKTELYFSIPSGKHLPNMIELEKYYNNIANRLVYLQDTIGDEFRTNPENSEILYNQIEGEFNNNSKYIVDTEIDNLIYKTEIFFLEKQDINNNYLGVDSDGKIKLISYQDLKGNKFETDLMKIKNVEASPEFYLISLCSNRYMYGYSTIFKETNEPYIGVDYKWLGRTESSNGYLAPVRGHDPSIKTNNYFTVRKSDKKVGVFNTRYDDCYDTKWKFHPVSLASPFNSL